MLYTLRYIWLAPITLPMVLFNFFVGNKLIKVEKGIFYFYSPKATLYSWWFKTFKFAAITQGAVITMLDKEYINSKRLIIHENTHVLQELTLGMSFPIVYVLNSIVVWLMGKDLYYDNWFEKQAFRSEKTGRSLELWE
mgnify:CR=1 FL=1